MENTVIVVILLAITAGIVYYLYKSKKRGDKCVGCPYARECGGNCSRKK